MCTFPCMYVCIYWCVHVCGSGHPRVSSPEAREKARERERDYDRLPLAPLSDSWYEMRTPDIREAELYCREGKIIDRITGGAYSVNALRAREDVCGGDTVFGFTVDVNQSLPVRKFFCWFFFVDMIESPTHDIFSQERQRTASLLLGSRFQKGNIKPDIVFLGITKEVCLRTLTSSRVIKPKRTSDMLDSVNTKIFVFPLY